MMKKNSGQSSEEPMGIVIAMGGKPAMVPQVRAYLWYEWRPEAATETKSVTG